MDPCFLYLIGFEKLRGFSKMRSQSDSYFLIFIDRTLTLLEDQIENPSYENLSLNNLVVEELFDFAEKFPH